MAKKLSTRTVPVDTPDDLAEQVSRQLLFTQKGRSEAQRLFEIMGGHELQLQIFKDGVSCVMISMLHIPGNQHGLPFAEEKLFISAEKLHLSFHRIKHVAERMAVGADAAFRHGIGFCDPEDMMLFHTV